MRRLKPTRGFLAVEKIPITLPSNDKLGVGSDPQPIQYKPHT
jgi:hypothetical protein